jgi:hypothetical protein
VDVSKKYIDEFKKIYLEKEGVILSDQEAKEKFLQLIHLFKLIYRPIPKSAK